MIYKWKTASCIKTSAEIVGAELEKLEQTIGVTAKNLVEVSRDENAPLHKEFECDDSIAAEKYRENQASHIIRSIVIEKEPETAEQKPVVIRAYLQTGSDEYEHISIISNDEEKKSFVIHRALMELEWFRNKYETISEMGEIIESINLFLDRMKGEKNYG